MGCCNKLSSSLNLKNIVFVIGVGQILLSLATIIMVMFAVCIIDVITDKAMVGIMDVEPEVGAELLLVYRIIRSVAVLYAVSNMIIAAILIKGNSLAENKVLLPYLLQGSLNTSGLITLFVAMFIISDWLMVGITAAGTVVQGIFMAMVTARYYQLNPKGAIQTDEEDTLLADS